MAELDLSGLLGVESPQARSKRMLQEGTALQQAVLAGSPAAVAASNLPRAQEAMRGSVGKLFGIDTRSPAEKATDQLKGLDPTDTAQQKQIISMVSKINPVGALQLATQFQAQNAKLANEQAQADANRATAELRRVQADLAPEEQNIARTTAEANRINAEANQFRVNNEIETWEDNYQLELDRIDAQNRRIDTDFKIAQLNSEALKSGDRARIEAAIAKSEEQAKAANSMRRIALAYEARQPLSGIVGKTVDKWEKFWGSQGEDAVLRAQATQVINGAALQFLPPGAASDADINMVREGFLTAFDDPKAVGQFMRGMQKASALESEYLKRKAAFMKNNSGLSVGFDDEWKAAVKEEGFIDFMKEIYGVQIITSEEQQAALDEQNAINFEELETPQQTRRGTR